MLRKKLFFGNGGIVDCDVRILKIDPESPMVDIAYQDIGVY